MLIKSAYKFQLKPKSNDLHKLSQFAGCCRYVWNKALELQKKQLDNKEKLFKYTELSKNLLRGCDIGQSMKQEPAERVQIQVCI